LSSLSVQGRVLLIVAALAAGFVAFLGVAAYQTQQTMMQERKDATRQVVEEAPGVVSAFGARADSGELTVQEAQAQAAETIRQLRYDGEEYF